MKSYFFMQDKVFVTAIPRWLSPTSSVGLLHKGYVMLNTAGGNKRTPEGRILLQRSDGIWREEQGDAGNSHWQVVNVALKGAVWP